MRKQFLFTAASLALALATVTVASQTPARATDAPWCATNFYTSGGLHCAFMTLQQCEVYVQGLSGQCSPNYRHLGNPARGDVTPQRRPRGRHSGI